VEQTYNSSLELFQEKPLGAFIRSPAALCAVEGDGNAADLLYVTHEASKGVGELVRLTFAKDNACAVIDPLCKLPGRSGGVTVLVHGSVACVAGDTLVI
jgi:hypothetical protein